MHVANGIEINLARQSFDRTSRRENLEKETDMYNGLKKEGKDEVGTWLYTTYMYVCTYDMESSVSRRAGVTKTKMCARYTDCERVVKGKEGFVLGQKKTLVDAAVFLSFSVSLLSFGPSLFLPLFSTFFLFSSLLFSSLPFPTIPYPSPLRYTYANTSIRVRVLLSFPSPWFLSFSLHWSLFRARSSIRRNASKNPSN